MGFSGGGAQQHVYPCPRGEQLAQLGCRSTCREASTQHPLSGFCVCLQAQTPQCQEMLVPPGEQRELPCPGTWCAACPPRHHTEWHTGTQHSWALAPCKRKAAAGCIAKPCVGSFLATHGISSYCFSSLRLLLQSLAKGSSICCLQLLSFTGHARKEPAAWKVAVQGLPVGFVLSFLHVVPQQLAQRTLSNSSTCCGAELPSPCYTDASDITYPCPQKAKAAVAEPAQRCSRCPRKGAGPRKTA